MVESESKPASGITAWPTSRHIKLTAVTFAVLSLIAYGIGRDWFMHNAQIPVLVSDQVDLKKRAALRAAQIAARRAALEADPKNKGIDQNLLDERAQIDDEYLGLKKPQGDDPVTNFVVNICQVLGKGWNELAASLKLSLLVAAVFAISCVVAAMIDQALPKLPKYTSPLASHRK